MLNVVTASKRESERSSRTCAGCREIASRDELVRCVLVPDHRPCLIPDLGTSLPGHGVWVHPRSGCVRKATRGGFARAFRRAVDIDSGELIDLIRQQVERRIQGLLLAGLRRRELALGTDAVRDAFAAGAVRLLLVAKDAAGRRDELCARADERGVPVVVLADKDELGRLTGKETLGLIAVLDHQIAREIANTARALAGLSEDG